MDTKATVRGLSSVVFNHAPTWTCLMRQMLDGTLVIPHERDCKCERTFRPRRIPVREKGKPFQSNGTVDWNRPEKLVGSPSNGRTGWPGSLQLPHVQRNSWTHAPALWRSSRTKACKGAGEPCQIRSEGGLLVPRWPAKRQELGGVSTNVTFHVRQDGYLVDSCRLHAESVVLFRWSTT